VPLTRLTKPVPASVPVTPSREDNAAAVTAANVPAISRATLILSRGFSSCVSVIGPKRRSRSVRSSNDEDVRNLSPGSFS